MQRTMDSINRGIVAGLFGPRPPSPVVFLGALLSDPFLVRALEPLGAPDVVARIGDFAFHRPAGGTGFRACRVEEAERIETDASIPYLVTVKSRVPIDAESRTLFTVEARRRGACMSSCDAAHPAAADLMAGPDGRVVQAVAILHAGDPEEPDLLQHGSWSDPRALELRLATDSIHAGPASGM